MTNTKNSRTTKKKEPAKTAAAPAGKDEGRSKTPVVILVSLIIAAVLELSSLNLLGQVGSILQSVQFGLFGIMAYVFPPAGFLLILYLIFRKKRNTKKLVCFIVLFFCLCLLTHLVTGMGTAEDALASAWAKSASGLTGGGVAGGALAVGLGSVIGGVGTFIVDIIAILVCVLLISEYPLIPKIADYVKGRRQARAHEEEYYQYEVEDYEPVKPTVSRKKKTYDSRAEALESKQDLPEYHKRARVYEGTDKEGNYIKIVHVPSGRKAKPHERAELSRTENKSRAVRRSTAPETLSRSEKKSKGLGEGLEFFPLDANGDEMHEITDRTARNRRYAVDAAEDAVTASAATEKTPVSSLQDAESTPFDRSSARKQAPADGRTADGKQAEIKTPERKTAARKTAEIKPADRKPASTAAKPVTRTAQKSTDDSYHYPPLDLLEKRKQKPASGNDDLNKVSRNLELILSTYGVNAKVIDAQEGPSVTRYELQPELGTRVSRITSLADDLKLNLAVPDIRIEAPIPGRAAIGIEIPNKTKETVLMRELLEEPTLISHPSRIAYAAGKDISGNVVVSDIAQMPHLLVAGTTGSGKSIFVNTILMTILFRAKPSEVGLIIIDPKKVEFGVYSGIPHLVQDVVTDPGQAVSTLRWAVVEMTNRYQRMQLSGVRDFKSYNAKFDKGQLNPEEENPKRMPQIVIVIDELADLMMVASKETESLICRLAQLARAAGIHLIIATQRPSVDVVTGLIKANIPARVALLVASGTDSRTIIDSNGAEKLLGKGDMLFYPTGYVKPVRVQGAFVSEKEVADTIQYIKDHNESGYYSAEAEELESYMNSSGGQATGIPGLTEDGGGSDSKYDEYFYEAGKLCIETGKASSSMIQRRFSIGFNRAARIIDQLQEVGAVGPQNGAKPREILVDEMQFDEIWNSLQA